MISKEKFKQIKEEYGHYSSWAVWSDNEITPTNKLRETMIDISFFEDQNVSNILSILKPEIVFVGLNISVKLENKLSNFHGNSDAHHSTLRHASKIREAFKNTEYYGGYMTDIIKSFDEPSSTEMISHLKENKEFEKKNIETFKKELAFLGVSNKIIFAFGGDTYNIMKRNHLTKEFNVIKIPHYSAIVSHEKYKKDIESILNNLK